LPRAQIAEIQALSGHASPSRAASTIRAVIIETRRRLERQARWETSRIRVAAHPAPIAAKSGELKREEINHLLMVAACLDGLENGSHVSVTETERARLTIEFWQTSSSGEATPASRAASAIRRLFSGTFEIVAWTATSRPTNFGAFTRETSLAIGPAFRTATN
jgi:hypothetical protein